MPKVIEQAGVIPVFEGKICVITSSNGQRWVIPKGMIDPGHTKPQAALNEAWEEAGLEGELSCEPLGIYHYTKERRIHRVTVYRLDVTSIALLWPERHRTREWVDPAEAVQRVAEVDLRLIIQTHFEYAIAGA